MPAAEPFKPPGGPWLKGEAAAAPLTPRASAGVVGDSASPQALQRLNAALGELKALQVRPLLQRAVAALEARDIKTGCDMALKALQLDEQNGYAWYLLAIAREHSADFRGALNCYEAALKLMPNQTDVANDLGRLAARLEMPQVAERLFRLYLGDHPENIDTQNNLACVVRDQGRSDEAIELLRTAIMAKPDIGSLWNTLGAILAERGDTQDSITFFDEACRLDVRNHRARYNRSTALMALGRYDEALKDCNAALKGTLAEHERDMIRLARATMMIAKGDLRRGWEAYEARHAFQYADATHFLIERPQWRPQDKLTGKTMLVMGEQGLGDEVLFANALPDLVEALGPEGRLYLAVEQRLIPLFQRSFPTAIVGPHATGRVDGHTVRAAQFIDDISTVDLWAPLASLLRRFRSSVDQFPSRPRFMEADPARVAYWRDALGDAGPRRKVGILWKSLKINPARARHFSPFDAWRPILQSSGLTFVNLQYGECAVELEQARQDLGVEIWQPPGIDLKNDLDEVAALTCALDLVLGPANATTNIAAACGAPVWLIGTPGSWPMLGTDHYPWYPQVRVFQPPAFNAWEPVMQEIAAALSQAHHAPEHNG